MNDLPLHPAIVHIPLVIALLAPVVLAYLTWRAFGAGAGRRAWAVIVALQGAVVGVGILGLRSGEAEEERVEAVVAEAAIEAHEHRAQAFVLGAGVVLGLTVFGLAAPRASRLLAPASLVAALVVAGLGVMTGHAGGSLVYRHGAAAAYTSSPAAAPRAHDDD
jgi:uncharacterized membrane protein